DLDTGRAAEFFRRGDYKEALRRAEVMLAAGPHVALSSRFKGECLFSLERYAEAVDCFPRAAELGGPRTAGMFLWPALSLHHWRADSASPAGRPRVPGVRHRLAGADRPGAWRARETGRMSRTCGNPSGLTTSLPPLVSSAVRTRLLSQQHAGSSVMLPDFAPEQ